MLKKLCAALAVASLSASALAAVPTFVPPPPIDSPALDAALAARSIGKPAKPALRAIYDAVKSGQSQVWNITSDSTGVADNT